MAWGSQGQSASSRQVSACCDPVCRSPVVAPFGTSSEGPIGFTDAPNHQPTHHQTLSSPNKIYNFKLPIGPPLRAPMLFSNISYFHIFQIFIFCICWQVLSRRETPYVKTRFQSISRSPPRFIRWGSPSNIDMQGYLGLLALGCPLGLLMTPAWGVSAPRAPLCKMCKLNRGQKQTNVKHERGRTQQQM